jgi:hypothetical protein
MTVGAAGDAHEQHADAVAESVSSGSVSAGVQRATDEEQQ